MAAIGVQLVKHILHLLDGTAWPADAIDWWAARNITEHPGQGWTLLCNGALVFDDLGALLPGGRVAAISGAPHTRLRRHA